MSVKRAGEGYNILTGVNQHRDQGGITWTHSQVNTGRLRRSLTERHGF